MELFPASLEDFDGILRIIDAAVNIGETFVIGLRDWIEESEFLECFELKKLSASALHLLNVDGGVEKYREKVEQSLAMFCQLTAISKKKD